MKQRTLRYARHRNVALQNNPEFNFAQNYAVKFYKANCICSFIPKNGCSTIRLSAAVANGCLIGLEDVDWIHANNKTFKATLEDLAVADFTFVILRDPYLRLASCFLDKFLSKEPPARAFRQAIGSHVDLDSLTFSSFVKSIGSVLRVNEHWRPQVDFLIYEDYDLYLSFGDFDGIRAAMEDRGLPFLDSRGKLSHHSGSREVLADREDYSATTIGDLATMKQKGYLPPPERLYTDSTKEIVKKLYRHDIDVYSSRTGRHVCF